MQKLFRGILSFSLVTTLLASALALPACSTTPETATDRAALSNKTTAFIENARTTDPSLSKFFDSCVGYASIPSIAKGGFVVVGAYGKGEVFDKGGARVGFCDVSQGSIGAQIGAQTFGEIIFFETNQSFAAFKGGKSEKAGVVAGDPDKSEILLRVNLGKDSDELMPPEGGPLPEQARAKLKEWVKDGAKWPDGFVLAAAVAVPTPVAPSATARPARPIPPLPELPKDFKPAAAEAAAIAALNKAGVDPRPLAQDSPWKEANFRLKGAEITDASLAPLSGLGSLVELRLGNTKITDAGLKSLSGLKHLQVLGLELTGVTDAGLDAVASLPNLVYLNLYGTKVTDAGIAKLAGLKHLRNLYVWQTQVTPEGVKKLEAALPGVDINTGWVAPAPEEKKEEPKK